MRRCLPLLLLLGGCSGGQAVAPGGLISNNPCIDAVLADIAAPGQVSAVSIYSHSAKSGSAPLNWAQKIPAIGTSAEEVIAARPKLLLTGNLSAGGTNRALAKAGVHYKAFGVPVSISENRAQIEQIAKLIGRETAGAALIGRIDKAVAMRPDNGARPSAIIWQSGGFVAGKNTLQDELLHRAGFANASGDYGLDQWQQLPLETLIHNPPHVIFMPLQANGDEGRALAARKRLLRHMPDTQIMAFPDHLFFCGGPNMIEAMERLKAARASFEQGAGA